MLNEVITGMAQAIRSLGDYAVYTSNVRQHLDAPCFVLSVVDVGQSRTLDNRFDRSQTFSAVYIPGTRDDDELRNMSDELLNAFEYIEVVGDIVRGTNIKCIESDGCLVCTVDYDMRLRIVTEKDNMETITTKGTVK